VGSGSLCLGCDSAQVAPTILGLFDNSSDIIFPENIHKLSEEQEKNLSSHGDQ
jgi:hypothetical protein